MDRRWSCVEAGCDWSTTAADAETIVPLVQEHMREAHASFELEDMIEDVLEDAVAPADDPVDPPVSPGGGSPPEALTR